MTDARHDAAGTRSEILELVGRYYRERHVLPPFDPERDAVRYGGRVFGEEEMRYLGCWNVAHLYQGAQECLRDLGAAGIRAFVVTNKRTSAAGRLLEHFRLARYFEDWWAT